VSIYKKGMWIYTSDDMAMVGKDIDVYNFTGIYMDWPGDVLEELSKLSIDKIYTNIFVEEDERE
jgi:hypothetical protein